MEAETIETRAARFSDRFVAYLIDGLPFGVGGAAAVWMLINPLAKPPTPELLAVVGAAWVTSIFGYQLLGNLTGGTIGKRLLGLRVVARDGGPPGFFRSLIRAALWLVGSTACNFGFLVALFNRENRTLHDYASGTVVVEAYRKSAAEGAVLFIAGAIGAIGLFVFQIYGGWARPTPRDKAAVAKAHDGLAVIARVQEAYKEKNGTYAVSIEQLAEASGDPDEFRTAMAVIFLPEPFKLEAGNRGWRIRAVARDRHRTPVVREGP
ncbi:MAG: RDD family protein [Elusimicrobiota bacterium]|nr:RDD family protein [Elusimicrobiota bacterium]